MIPPTLTSRGTVAVADRLGWGEAVGMNRRRSCPQLQPAPSAFAGYRFPPEVIG